MTIDPDKLPQDQHRFSVAGGIQVVCWADGVAGNLKTATHVYIEPTSQFPSVQIEPDERLTDRWYLLRKYIMLLQIAYCNGRRDFQKDFRNFIGASS